MEIKANKRNEVLWGKGASCNLKYPRGPRVAQLIKRQTLDFVSNMISAS